MSEPGSYGTWRNRPVRVNTLPAVDETPFEPLEAAYLKQQRVLWVAVVAALAIGGVVAILIGGAPWWIAAVIVGVAFAVAVTAWVLEGLAFSYRGVQLREFDVSARHGLISRATVSVPFSRVQHVTVERGLLDRVFGLAQVVIFTAGAGSADARVKGLDPERAERLREGLVNRSNELTRTSTSADARPDGSPTPASSVTSSPAPPFPAEPPLATKTTDAAVPVDPDVGDVER